MKIISFNEAGSPTFLFFEDARSLSCASLTSAARTSFSSSLSLVRRDLPILPPSISARNHAASRAFSMRARSPLASVSASAAAERTTRKICASLRSSLSWLRSDERKLNRRRLNTGHSITGPMRARCGRVSVRGLGRVGMQGRTHPSERKSMRQIIGLLRAAATIRVKLAKFLCVADALRC